MQVSRLPLHTPTIRAPSRVSHRAWRCMQHGGLLSLNAWKLSPTPRKIEMVTYTHSNEPDNRCLLEPAVHGYIKRNQHLKAILAVINTFELYCKQKSRGLVLPTVGSGTSNLSTYARRSPTTCVQKTTTTLGD